MIYLMISELLVRVVVDHVSEVVREPVGLYAFLTDSHVWQLKISEH